MNSKIDKVCYEFKSERSDEEFMMKKILENLSVINLLKKSKRNFCVDRHLVIDELHEQC